MTTASPRRPTPEPRLVALLPRPPFHPPPPQAEGLTANSRGVEEAPRRHPRYVAIQYLFLICSRSLKGCSFPTPAPATPTPSGSGALKPSDPGVTLADSLNPRLRTPSPPGCQPTTRHSQPTTPHAAIFPTPCHLIPSASPSQHHAGASAAPHPAPPSNGPALAPHPLKPLAPPNNHSARQTHTHYTNTPAPRPALLDHARDSPHNPDQAPRPASYS